MSYLSKIFNVVAGTGLLILGYNHYRTTQKLKRLRKSNSEKNRITSELRLASQIQQSMRSHMSRLYGDKIRQEAVGGLYKDTVFELQK